jgi:putative ABC transport system permease protein
VVGVVDDVLYAGPREGVRPEVFVPLGVWAPGGLNAIVRTAAPPERLAAPARAALARIDRAVAFTRVVTGTTLRHEDVAETRLLVLLLGGFAAAALLLCASGIFAAVSQMVGERRREIAVRLALGASRRSVEALLVRRHARPLCAGLAAGMGAAAVLAAELDALLFGVRPLDPGTHLAAAAAAAAVWLAASWWPARRVGAVEIGRTLKGD